MGDQSEHSLLSASAAPRWTRCYGSVALESTQPNKGSKFAAEGTAAHGLSAYLLSDELNKEITMAVLRSSRPWGSSPKKEASDFIGCTITADGMSFEVDEDFAMHVQHYVDYVESLGGVRMVEVRVNYANWLGVPKELAWGTSDAICVYLDPKVITINAEGYLNGREIGVDIDGSDDHTGRLIMSCVDLKFGQGVAVYPDNNEQALLYAGGSLNEIELLIDVQPDDIVEVVIHQPRIGEGSPLSWYVPVKELKLWLKTTAAMAAQHAVKLYDDLQNGVIAAQDIKDLTPGDKQCRFCNAKAVCPALTSKVVNEVANAFVDLDDPEKGTIAKTISAGADVSACTPIELAEKMRWLDLIEGWVKAVRGATETKLLAGELVPGYKLVRGKMGSRRWIDEEAAAKRLKRYLGAALAMRDPEPISPTEAEKRLKKAGQGKAYTVLEKEFITQSEGGISVARQDDKREAYVPAAVVEAAFTDLGGEADDLSHLA